MFRYLLVCSLLFLAGLVSGQGWERVFDAGGTGQINDIATTPDGGFIMAGNYNGITRAHLLKTDADGFQQWSKDYFLGVQTSAEAIAATKDGGYIISGFQRDATGPRKAFLMKTDAWGDTEWTYIFPGNGADAEALDILEDPNEDAYIACGYQKELNTKENFLIIKVDGNGSPLWSNTFGILDAQEKAFAIAADLNGDLLIAGERRETGKPRDFYVVHVLNNTGASDWENTYGLGPTVDDVARDIVVTADGGFVLAGQTGITQPASGIIMKIDGNDYNTILWQTPYPKSDLYGITRSLDGGIFVTGNKTSASVAQEELFLAKANSEGEKQCEVLVGRPGTDRGYCIVATPDGGAVAAGSGEIFVQNVGEENLYMVKMDKNCKVFTSYLQGNIFHDYNTNCLRDGNEPGLEDWIVRIESPNFTRYAVARTDGSFELLVDTGTYIIQLFPPNDAWESCDPVITLPVTAFSDTFSIDIPVKAAFACPRNEVDIATPILRKCADNVYTVRYCNAGTIPSLNTKIEVTLDPGFTYISSSNPNVTPGPNNTYTFNIGFLANGDCGSFTITARLDCDATIGEAHCVRAHIFPDAFCDISSWNGTIIEARAFCENNVVKLALANVGTSNLAETIGFVIAEDVIMLTAPGSQSIDNLSVGEEQIVWQAPATGKTYRIIAEQVQSYPGTSYPTAAVERCLADTSSSFTIGSYTMFPEDEAEPFKAVDCQETYDTDFNTDNLKRGHPKGYGVFQYVTPVTDLEYLIQFQNSGTDTVHQVVIRDTLSPYLDPATVHPGAASHPYDFDVYGPGIVQFTLQNLNLPPGSSASEGFVTFKVSIIPEAQLPAKCGTEILNSAAIYMDFNAPVLTSQTLHTVCEFDTFVVVKTKNIEFHGAEVKVFPNPFDESAVFEIRNVPASGFNLELYDLQGRKVFNQSYNHPSFRLYRHQLPAGTLFYRLTTNKGQPVASGKLLVY